jgi:cardiolipin synthase (CMP-forming)
MFNPQFKQQIPNILTISRVVMVAPIVIIFSISYDFWAHLSVMIIFMYACATDFIDGWLSRKWNCVSDLGRLLDPIADKLLVAALLIILIPTGKVNAVAVSLILVRELFVSGLREFMQEKQIVIHVSELAKWKTALQMFCCWLFLWVGIFEGNAFLLNVASTTLWASVFITLYTGYEYLRGSLKYLLSK